MKVARRRWLYIVSGLILLGLSILALQNLTNNVTADQGINRAANLNLTRTITNRSGSDISSGMIQRGESFFLNYRITPEMIAGIPQPTSQQIRISNITFTEVLPANVEIDTTLLPSGFTSSGNQYTGYSITGSLGDINYRWDSITQSLKPDLTSNSRFNGGSIIFSIPASSTVSQDYTFTNSRLDYNDLHEVSSATPTSAPTPTSTFDPMISNSGSTIGVIGDYSLFFLHNGSTTGNITINGNLAVGEDLSLTNTSGGGTIRGNVIVGNNLKYGDNQTGESIGIGGNLIYGKNFNYGTTSLNGIKGTISRENPMRTIDFNTVGEYWTKKSKEYGMLKPNGTATIKYENQLYLEVTDTSLPYYVFNIKEEQISQAAGIIINTPENSTVIINIMGYSDQNKVLDMGKWTNYNGQSADYNKIEENTKKAHKILYNFPEARRIKLIGGQIGTFLAPWATIEATNGSLVGAIVASSWNFGNGTGLLLYASPFKGELPIIPTPTPSATTSPSPSSPPVAIPHVTRVFSPIMISVISLDISGNTNVFVNKSIDLTLITGNLPSDVEITWSLLGDGAKYATLTEMSDDKRNYKLTGKEIHDGIVVSVTAGGATTNHVVNVIPFSLTGLRAREEIEIRVGDEYNLNQLLWITPNEMTIDDIRNDLEWISDTPSIASFDSPLIDELRRGTITGIEKGGPAIVTVFYKPSVNVNPIKTSIKVKVTARENGDRY